ncbi:helix-turn-helix domain-containing protein [Pseudoalteromonas sp. R3]|uniref:winged helix-turn-helix transcriptional regulator n=1 Tax=Pseudoalteromonas sp. R3 TaxID=1709477 RepID=UPI0006B612D5|nr:helix-turn-helix domain-containing protein [Pseudoalteromonas sp. R3]AZZ99911.1 transcriptional regulator [Pseudoalteromonas sp. R3]
MAENNALRTEENDINLGGCPMTSVMNVIGGKWKVIILFHLRDNTLRFGELKKRIPKITQKMLTQQLRELEADGLVSREVYAEVPPRVEYTSTGLSDELRPILDMLCEWGQRQQDLAHKKGDT